MTALAAPKSNVIALEALGVQLRGHAVNSGARVWQGSAVARDPSASGNVKVAAAGKPFYQMLGVASASLLGDGSKYVLGAPGLCEFENSDGADAVPSTLPLGWPLYAVDDQTVGLTNGAGTRSKLGVFGGWSNKGKPLVWVGVDPYALGEITWPVVFGFAEVAGGGAALTVDLSFGPPLPGPARMVGYSTDVLTVFSGGAIATATFSLGTSAGGTQVHTALDIFTGAAAAPKKGTAGSLGYNCAPFAAGTQFQGRVTTTTGNVSAAIAGAYAGSIILRPGS